MRPEIFKITVCGLLSLLAVSALAVDGAGVENIMQELKGGASPAVAETAPAVPVAAVQPVSADQLLAESREAYVAGDYAQAEEGFKKAEKLEPGNPASAFYLQQMAKNAHGSAEEAALANVDSGWVNGMQLDYFPLSAEAQQRMGFSSLAEPTDVKASFPEIVFPAEAKVIYRPNLKKLFVYSTPGTLRKIRQTLEALRLADMQRMAEQVEIETRFVEFSEGALTELGFNWSDAADGQALKVGGSVAVKDGEDLFAGALRSVPFAQPQTTAGDVSAGAGDWNVSRIEDVFSNQAGTLGIRGKVNNSNIDLLIRALDQTSGADVLSAPRVVTLSGVPAVIKVGQEHSFPRTYEGGTSLGTVLHVRYNDFTQTLLGVEMKVTPVIKADEINLMMNPRITELAGWQQFELAPADSSYTYFQYHVGMQFNHDPVVARLPVFKRRELKAEVNVQDGATIAMGGLINQTTESFNDKVPVLGSLPLVGRLFRSEGERTVKRDLMIFVTARKVQPNGLMAAERSFDK